MVNMIWTMLMGTRCGLTVGLIRGGALSQTRRLIGERQQRLTLRTGETAARMLAEKKQHKGEDQTKADGEGERDD